MAHILLLIFMAGLNWLPAQPTIKPSLKATSSLANIISVAAQDTAAQATGKKKKKSKKAKIANKSRVTLARDVARVTLTKKSDDGNNTVEVVVMSSGTPIRNVEDMQMTGNSGTTTSAGSYMGFDNVSVPFEGNIRFKAPNKMNTAVYDREVRFEVDEPGKWTLRIDI